MYPILLKIGAFHLYSFSVFIILAWALYSFLFWRSLRAEGVSEEHIFDTTFWATVGAFVASRLGFVAFHWDIFSPTLLKIPAIWVAPGLSFYSSFLAGVGISLVLARRYKMRLGWLLDAFAASIPLTIIIGSIASLLDGSEVGAPAHLPFAIRYVGHEGLRHPYQLYVILAMGLLGIGVGYLGRRAKKDRWAYGLVGIWFFLLLSALMFGLEFVKESNIYWKSLSVNQWVLIALFGQSFGVYYVLGGGKEHIRNGIHSIVRESRNAYRFMKEHVIGVQKRLTQSR